MKQLAIFFLATVVLVSCGSGNQEGKSGNSKKSSVSLTAAGATFPLPFYNLSIKNYSTQAGVTVNYGGIGSGGGITSLKDRVVDFGATDAFLSQDQEDEMPADIVHIPTCIGAVVIAYNLEGVDGLKLSNKNLEDIFMGKITMWNDERIRETNPGLSLPEMAVTVVERSDGSGTTYIFSDFMSKISKEWEASVGRGKSLNWPVGIGAKGNPGVAGTIKETPGAVGYVGSEFAFAQKIQFAEVENSAGNYVKPSLESISAAARGEIPASTKVMLTCSSDPEAYPISGFTWIILYKEQNYNNRNLAQAEETLKFLSWLIEDEAQALAQQVHYAPLPAKTVEQAKVVLGSVTFDGKPVLNN